MDLGTITSVSRTADVNFKNGQPCGVKVTLVGPDDPKLKKIRESITNKVTALQAKGKSLKADEMTRNRWLILFNAMESWEWTGTVNFDGDKPELNQKNAFEVFERLTWFADSVDEHFSETESFFAQPVSGD